MLPTVPRFLLCLALAQPLLSRSIAAASDEAASTCPARADVLTALDQILERKLDPKTAATIEVRDQGDTWEIRVGDRQTAYTDASRACAERVRVATIFSALVIEPFGHEPVRVNAAPPPAPPPPAKSEWHHGLEVAPLFVALPRSSIQDAATSWGGSLRYAATRTNLGVTCGLGGMLPLSLDLARYEASMTKMSFDISLRATLHAGRLGLSAEIGPYAALMRTQGRGLPQNETSYRFDGGGRVALHIQLQLRWVSPFLAAQAEWSARKFILVVDSGEEFLPSGEAGVVPRVWLGAGAGLAFGF